MGLIGEAHGHRKVLNMSADIISMKVTYICTGASRVSKSWLRVRSTDSLSAQRRDGFYFRTAVASRDPDATDSVSNHPPPISCCPSAPRLTLVNPKLRLPSRILRIYNVRMVSNNSYVPNERLATNARGRLASVCHRRIRIEHQFFVLISSHDYKPRHVLKYPRDKYFDISKVPRSKSLANILVCTRVRIRALIHNCIRRFTYLLFNFSRAQSSSDWFRHFLPSQSKIGQDFYQTFIS